MPQIEVSPAQRHPASQQGGKREVKTRLEEPGGGWRMEVLNISFIFKQGRLVFNQFVVCGLAGQPHVPVSSRVEGDKMTQMKVKILSLI